MRGAEPDSVKGYLTVLEQLGRMLADGHSAAPVRNFATVVETEQLGVTETTERLRRVRKLLADPGAEAKGCL